MLESVEISSLASPDPLRLSFDPESKFPIRFIDGLGSPKAELVNAHFAGLDRGYHQSSRLGSRNIVLTLNLNADWGSGEEPEDLRALLTRYLKPGFEVYLTFYRSKGDPLQIVGYVETMETVLFDQTPAAQSSIVCVDPYFKGPEKTIRGEVTSGEGISLAYAGQTNSPVFLDVMVNRDVPALDFTIQTADRSNTVSVGTVIEAAEHIVIDTTPGGKRVIVPHLNETESSFDVLAAPINWPYLAPGANNVIFRATHERPLTFYYTLTYREEFVTL